MEFVLILLLSEEAQRIHCPSMITHLFLDSEIINPASNILIQLQS